MKDLNDDSLGEFLKSNAPQVPPISEAEKMALMSRVRSSELNSTMPVFKTRARNLLLAMAAGFLVVIFFVQFQKTRQNQEREEAYAFLFEGYIEPEVESLSFEDGEFLETIDER